MKFILVLLFAVLAVAAAQRRTRYLIPRIPVLPSYGDEEYAASLGGAPIGLYRKTDGRGGYGRPMGGSEVSGISLGGAKVGFYGRDRASNRYPLLG